MSVTTKNNRRTMWSWVATGYSALEVSNEQYKRCYERGSCPEPPDNSYWSLPAGQAIRLPT